MAKRRNMKRKTLKQSNKLVGGSRKRKVKKTKKKKSNWMKNLAQARKELGLKGFVAINKGVNGKALYKRAKELNSK